jgi:hypothetical protein
MVDDATGQLVHVIRIRERRADKLQIITPDLAEMNHLADDIEKCADELQAKFKDAFDLDEKIQRWVET